MAHSSSKQKKRYETFFFDTRSIRLQSDIEMQPDQDNRAMNVHSPSPAMFKTQHRKQPMPLSSNYTQAQL